MAAKVKIIRHIDNHLRWIFDFFGHRDSIGFQFVLVLALGRLLPGVFWIWRTMSKCGRGARCQKKWWYELERIYKTTYSCLMADWRYFPKMVISFVSKFELLVAELAITVSCLQISNARRKFPKNTHPANMSAKYSNEKRQRKFPQRWPHSNLIHVEEAGGICQSGWKSS
ncbi:hypothetical protein [Prevotella sp. P5-64]|uniref:hypothetical protein n=1 Tax=Prevotella sp. P5-64 TaxID=2024226 RepID=UPI00117C8D20|nr:hypothetical protein [Prevotella sp. P5-64]